jgi:hypothetical protein
MIRRRCCRQDLRVRMGTSPSASGRVLHRIARRRSRCRASGVRSGSARLQIRACSCRAGRRRRLLRVAPSRNHDGVDRDSDASGWQTRAMFHSQRSWSRLSQSPEPSRPHVVALGSRVHRHAVVVKLTDGRMVWWQRISRLSHLRNGAASVRRRAAQAPRVAEPPCRVVGGADLADHDGVACLGFARPTEQVVTTDLEVGDGRSLQPQRRSCRTSAPGAVRARAFQTRCAH